MTVTAEKTETGVGRNSPAAPVPAPLGRLRLSAVALALAAVVVALALVDIAQGTAAVGPVEIVQAVLGRSDQSSAAVIAASRLPRAEAGILVGLALGIAGAALQAISRNVLASPDTLAVNAGGYLALTVFAVTGFSLPLVASSGAAFLGGLVAAAVVLGLSRLGSGTVRLVLAGSALALGLSSVTSALILLFPQETEGLYDWGEGSISQSGPGGVLQMLPIVVVGVAGLLVLGRRMDALALGDDAASSLGVSVRAVRAGTVVFAVLLSAAAVTIAGPIGFVGLAAPALVRPLQRIVPGLARSRAFLPIAGLSGAAVVLASDVLLRLVVGADTSVRVPTGVVTSFVGAVFLVVLAFRAKDGGGEVPTDSHPVTTRARVALVLAALVVVLVGIVIAGVLLGDAKLLLGDVANWLRGQAGQVVTYVLGTRIPRVLAALAAGAALALAGTLVQAVTRNPLAEPGILGVSGGAGLGAVLFVTTVPAAATWGIAGAAFAGAAIAAAVVFGLASRGGFQQNRLVLIGVGMASATTALISLLIVTTDPYNAAKALTWLSGSTYGRTLPDIAPVAIALVIGLVVAATRHRELDLVSLDEDTPRLLGLPLGRARLVFLATSVLLTGAAIASVGTIVFVGLVAPHAARALVGRRHGRVIPVAVLLGAILVSVGDTAGRTVIAPGQLGAGLLTALIGTPYFLWLLWRSRR